MGEAAGGGEDRPRGEADALGQGQLEQAQRVDRLGQLQPEEVAAAGTADPGLLGEVTRHRREHGVLLGLQGVAQLAQVAVVAAVLEIVGDGRLGRDRRRQAGHQLQSLDLLGVASAGHPADPVARRQALGEGTAVHHQAFLVVGLDRFRRLLAEVQLGVDVILDHRHLVARQQLGEGAFLLVVHARAHRVLEVAHEPAGLDRQALQAVGEHFQVDAFARMHGDFHRLQLQPFQHLQGGVERRRLDGHQVAGTGDHLQAEVECLQRAVADDQFFHRQQQAADHVAQGDLPAQAMVARRHVGDHRLRVHVAHRVGHRARQARQGKQLRAGERRAEGHGVRVLDRTEYGEHQLADVDLGGVGLARADLRFRQRPLHVLADEVAGACAGHDQPTAFQQVVGLEHGGSADPVGTTGVPYRGHLLPGGEDAGADQLGNLVGEFLVALHLVLAAVLAGRGHGRWRPLYARRDRVVMPHRGLLSAPAKRRCWCCRPPGSGRRCRAG